MAWTDELGRLLGSTQAPDIGGAIGHRLGEVGGALPFQDQRNQLGPMAGGLGNAVGPALGGIVHNVPMLDAAAGTFLSDNPFRVKDVLGTPLYGIAKAGSMIDPGNQEFSRMVNRYENGYTTTDGRRFSGGRALWEESMADNPWMVNAAFEVAADPFNLLSGGAGGVVGKGARELAQAGGRIATSRPVAGRAVQLLGTGVDYTARAYGTPDMLFDNAIGKGIGKIAGGVTGKVKNLAPVAQALDLDKESSGQRVINRARTAGSKYLMGRREVSRAGFSTPTPRAPQPTFPGVPVSPPNPWTEATQAPQSAVPKAVRKSVWANTPTGKALSAASNTAIGRLIARYGHDAQKVGFLNRSISGLNILVPETAQEMDEVAAIGANVLANLVPEGAGMWEKLRALQNFRDEARNALAERGVADADDALIARMYVEARRNRPDLPKVRWTSPEVANFASMEGYGARTTPTDVSDEMLRNYVSTVGAGNQIALRQGGSWDQFTTPNSAVRMMSPQRYGPDANPIIQTGEGGKFRDFDDFLEFARQGVPDVDSGLRVHTLDEFIREMSDELGLGGLDQQGWEVLYRDSMKKFHDTMVEASWGYQKKSASSDPKEWKIVGGLPMNVDEMADALQRGAAGQDFYRANVLPLRNMFPDDDTYIRFLAVWAANSPRNTVPQNAKDALSQWATFHLNVANTGDPEFDPLRGIGFTDEQIQALGRSNLGVPGMMGARRANGIKAMKGEDFEGQKINDFLRASVWATQFEIYEGAIDAGEGAVGQQVRVQVPNSDFPVTATDTGVKRLSGVDYGQQKLTANEIAQEMRANLESHIQQKTGSTMDVWHSRGNYLKDAPSVQSYLVQRHAVRRVADELGVSPDDIQAAVWATFREDTRFKAGSADALATGAPAATELLRHLRRYGEGPEALDNFMKAEVKGTVDGMLERVNRAISRSKGSLVTFNGNIQGRFSGKPTASASDLPDNAVMVNNWLLPKDEKTARDIVHIRLMMQDAMDDDFYGFTFGIADTGDNVSFQMHYRPRSGVPVSQDAAAQYIVESVSGIGDDIVRMRQELPGIIARSREIEDFTERFLNRANETAQQASDLVDGTFLEQYNLWSSPHADERLRATETGATYRVIPAQKVGNQWQPARLEQIDSAEMQRPVVTLASAGPNGNIHPPEDRQLRIAEFMRMSAPILARSDGDVVFGTYYNPESQLLSFDLNLLARDADEAERIAKLTNQESYYDPERGVVPVGGTGDSPYKTPNQIARLIGDVVNARNGDPSGMAIDSVGLLPQGAQQIWSVLDGVKKMLPGWKAKNGIPDVDEVDLTAEMLQNPQSNYVPWLTDEDNAALFGEAAIFSKDAGPAFEGKYHGQVLWESTNEIQRDQALLKKLDERLQGTADFSDRTKHYFMRDHRGKNLREAINEIEDADVRKMANKWADLGIDIFNTDADEGAMRVLGDAILKEMGFENEHARGLYNTLSQAWREQVTLSPKYHAGNLTGGFIMSAIQSLNDTRYGRRLGSGLPGLAEFLVNAETAFKGTWRIGETLPGFKTAEKLNQYGYKVAPGEIVKQNSNQMLGKGESALGRTLGKIFPMARTPINKLVDGNKAIAASLDMTFRGSGFTDIQDSVVLGELPGIQARIRGMAEKQGISLDGVDLLPNHNPAFLYGYYKSVGFSDGYAQRVSRDMAEAIKKGEAEGLRFINKTQFSYEYTNIDRFVSKFVPFHYWYSRAARFYVENAIRNPILVRTYFKYQDGMEDAENDAGLNARQKGFIRLMRGPQGFALLMNPDALFGVVKGFGLQDEITPDGETAVGGVLRTLKKYGVGLYPWIDSTLNMMGTYGDTFEPDMLGIRHRALVGSVMQWAASQGLFGDVQGPLSAPYAEMNANARAVISKWTSSFAPDWLSQPVMPKANANGTISRASLDTIIENRILARNPGLTGQQLLEIMNDPDSLEYREAWNDAASAGVIQQLLNITLPVTMRVRENSRDVRTAQMSLIRAEAEERGVSPEELQTTTGDVEFARTYRLQTGKNFTASDYKDAEFKSELARATPQARIFVVHKHEYESIGTDGAKDLMDKYNRMRSGEWYPENYPAPRFPQDLPIYADHWLRAMDVNGEVEQMRQLRAEYRTMHPDFDAYKNWESQMWDVRAMYGGLSTYRNQAAQMNPNAAQYFETKTRYWRDERGLRGRFLEEALDNETVSVDAYISIVLGGSSTPYEAAPQPTHSPSSMPADPGGAMYQTGIEAQEEMQPTPHFVNSDWEYYLNRVR